MAQEEGTDGATPAYLPFTTFQSAIESLREHGLPTKIDKSAFGSRSGTDQRLIMGAIKFLKLIDANDLPLPALKLLHDSKADSEQERQCVASLLRESYGQVFNTVDLASATPLQLKEAIQSYGIEGSTRDRAVRFFIKAAEHCGIQLSGRLTRVTRNKPDVSTSSSSTVSTATTSKRTRPKKRVQALSSDSGSNSDTAAMKQISLPIAKGTLILSGNFNPFELVGEERELIYQIIDKMNAYERKAKRETRDE